MQNYRKRASKHQHKKDWSLWGKKKFKATARKCFATKKKKKKQRTKNKERRRRSFPSSCTHDLRGFHKWILIVFINPDRFKDFAFKGLAFFSLSLTIPLTTVVGGGRSEKHKMKFKHFLTPGELCHCSGLWIWKKFFLNFIIHWK